MHSYMLCVKIKVETTIIRMPSFVALYVFGVGLRWFKDSEFIGTHLGVLALLPINS